MAFVGALRTCGAPVPLTWVLGSRLTTDLSHHHTSAMNKARSPGQILLAVIVIVWCVFLPFYWARTISRIASSEYFDILPFYVPQLVTAAVVIVSLVLAAYRVQLAIYGLATAAALNVVLQFLVGSPTYGTWPITSGLPLLLAWQLHQASKACKA